MWLDSISQKSTAWELTALLMKKAMSYLVLCAQNEVICNQKTTPSTLYYIRIHIHWAVLIIQTSTIHRISGWLSEKKHTSPCIWREMACIDSVLLFLWPQLEPACIVHRADFTCLQCPHWHHKVPRCYRNWDIWMLVKPAIQLCSGWWTSYTSGQTPSYGRIGVHTLFGSFWHSERSTVSRMKEMRLRTLMYVDMTKSWKTFMRGQPSRMSWGRGSPRKLKSYTTEIKCQSKLIKHTPPHLPPFSSSLPPSPFILCLLAPW